MFHANFLRKTIWPYILCFLNVEIFPCTAHVLHNSRTERLPPGPPQVIINMEWGAFGDNGCVDFLKTELDHKVEKQSNHVGSYT